MRATGEGRPALAPPKARKAKTSNTVPMPAMRLPKIRTVISAR